VHGHKAKKKEKGNNALSPSSQFEEMRRLSMSLPAAFDAEVTIPLFCFLSPPDLFGFALTVRAPSKKNLQQYKKMWWCGFLNISSSFNF
jgi:hypothetical protein